MKHSIALFLCGVALAAQAQPVRIGTFNRQALVVAYYRSPQWAEILKTKKAERDTATRAGDSAKAKALEAWGQNSQELAHRQLAGEAPITSIVEALAPALPEIARKANVAAIAVDLPYAAPAVETVDVTALLLDWLQANEATRNVIRELRDQMP